MHVSPQPRQFGEILVAKGLITPQQLESALRLSADWGSRLGDVILTTGWVQPMAFYQALADHFQLEFVDLVEQPVDAALLDRSQLQRYSQALYIPWKRVDGALWIATAEPGSPEIAALKASDPALRVVVTSKFDIIWELQRTAHDQFNQEAVHHLVEHSPEYSARTVVTRPQKQVFAAIAIPLLILMLWYPSPVLITLNVLMNLFLFASFLFRTMLCWMSCGESAQNTVTPAESAALRNQDLPVYTVLVPMYKEPAVLPILAAALRNMDYPRSKLDIKLVLEADDTETINAAKALALDATFEIIRVPPSLPKTKPKACNYALKFARGKYLTIYDAEDKPEPDQLKKALVTFEKLGPKTACVQARLNYFNAEENWLTRMFTLEYSLWFDMFLPALDRLGIPIPLGGTSNHFHLEKLRAVGAWDPFNVTEDADLGLRFAAMGFHVAVVNSVTYEEANSHTGNWIRQRSRWIKGHTQTWLVNMRDPAALIRRVGLRGFCSLQLFIGGGVLSALAYPFMVLPFLFWVLTRTTSMATFFPAEVRVIAFLNLVAGNSFLIYLSMLAAAKRHHFSLVPHALTAPAYWCLMSIAGYKGLWQLVTRPFYWEKTNHGISRFTKDILRSAISS
jgi:glycosyltransferase XagB